MNCAESRLLLHADADRELDVASSLELARHLKTCAACGADVNAIRSLKATLQQPSLRHDVPTSLRREIRRMTRKSVDDSQPRLGNSLRFWKWLAFGTTAAAILMLVLRPEGVSEQDQLLNEAVAGHVRSLMADHLTDVASSDQHTVNPWFNGKLDFAPEVKDFAAAGFPLVGGRLDYLKGRSVAVLVYGRNKHLVNVFIWPESATAGGKLSAGIRRGYSIINRRVGDLHYCLVSDLNEKDLAELASLFEDGTNPR